MQHTEVDHLSQTSDMPLQIHLNKHAKTNAPEKWTNAFISLTIQTRFIFSWSKSDFHTNLTLFPGQDSICFSGNKNSEHLMIPRGAKFTLRQMIQTSSFKKKTRI